MNEIELENGKYTIIYNEKPFEFKALRYGEEWRDLTGDNLILALINHISDLEARLHL